MNKLLERTKSDEGDGMAAKGLGFAPCAFVSLLGWQLAYAVASQGLLLILDQSCTVRPCNTGLDTWFIMWTDACVDSCVMVTV
jgi:hypothetical protein